jgi:GNAT superfamily N-acetyltransferase
MQIRKATTHDQDQLVDLVLHLQLHVEQSNPHLWRLTTTGRQNLVHDVTDMLSDPHGLVLIVEHQSHIVGFAYGQIFQRADYAPPKVGQISRIFVQQDQRRRGIGTQLIRELYAYFKAEQVRHISLRYVVGNIGAEAFWSQLGFNPIISIAYADRETLQEHLK